MKTKTYVLTYQGGAPIDGGKKQTNIIVYGPFKSYKKASAWGEDWQQRNNDDPRWNTIALSKQRIGVNTLLVPVIKI